MKYEYYYVEDENKKTNCIIRAFCKLFNKEYEEVKQELINIAKELNYETYAEIEVFEKYLNDNNYKKIEHKEEQIKNLKLEKGKYAVFCYDKKDYYHMLPIINNTVYDKTEDNLNLYTITIYKEQ
jgi:hypothetical protein